MTLPTKLNLGCGLAFIDDYLNLDCNAVWLPDILADLEQPLPPEEPWDVHTRRFGKIEIRRGQFDFIRAHDVLEHVHHLVTCMTSCRDLLKPGGTIDIHVPYDLSHGAWQDPTHVRAFNENSWLYYSGWRHYLKAQGWERAWFQPESHEFELTPVGQKLKNQGLDDQEVRRTPRAVGFLHVVFKKVVK